MSTKPEATKELVCTEYRYNTQQSRDPILNTLIQQNQKLMELLPQKENKENMYCSKKMSHE